MNEYKKLKIWLSSSDSTGCGHYRIKKPAQFLQKHFDDVIFTLGFPPQDPRLMEQDVIILQRINHESFLDWIPEMQKLGKKIILDMDDNIWEIPSANLSHRHYPSKITKRMTEIVKLVDGITTSTIPLGQYMQKWNPNVVIIPNMIDSVFPFKEKPEIEKYKIGWTGSYTHAYEFGHKLVDYFRDKFYKKQEIDLEFTGFCPQYFKNMKPTVHEWKDADEYFSHLNNLNFDIGYAVVDNNTFNTCKSNIKFLEYSACSVASVMQSCYPYDNTIEHGETGFLVKNEKTDWKQYFEFLLNDKKEFDRIRRNAWEFVDKNFTYEKNGEMILGRYNELFNHLYKGTDISAPVETRYQKNGLTL